MKYLGKKKYNRNNFGRTKPKIMRPKNVILIITEGKVSEPNYLKIIKDLKSKKHYRSVSIYGNGSNTPHRLIGAVQSRFRNGEMGNDDEVWIVSDVDELKKDFFSALFDWKNENQDQHNLAISNPNIEFWFLLHLDPGDGANDKNRCVTRLKKKLKDEIGSKFRYDKVFPPRLIKIDKVNKALDRARDGDKGQDPDWPMKGSTKIYKLIDVLLANCETET